MEKYTHVYFVGIGGIGMSAIARYFNTMGMHIAGYDKTSTPLTDELSKEGMQIHFDDDVNLIPADFKNISRKENTLVVYTPAIPKNHAEYNHFLNNDYKIVKRSQVLGLITAANKTVAVAGTHGKTTTSSMVAHVLKSSGLNVAAFLGGIAKNYDSNFILPQAKSEIINVVEADEFDRSFLTLFPQYAIITSMDADHLDIYGDSNSLTESYNLFANQVKDDGLIIYKKGLPLEKTKAKAQTYSITEKADYYTTSITIQNNEYCFDMVAVNQTISGFTLGLPGRHNVENAVAATAVALQLGVNADDIKHALKTYSGVKRRFDTHIKNKEVVFIDDYAHHPEELRAAISSVKELYQGKKITGIFQPHLFSRTRDFVDGFAQSLSLLDEVILLDIYPARELPMEGITSNIILDKIITKNKKLVSKDELLTYISNNNFEVVVTLGAGDIDSLVNPIKQILLAKTLTTHS